MENKEKLKDIKSFCKKFFKGFTSVIVEYETYSKLDINLCLQNIFIQSIDSIGRILSSSFFIKNNIHLNGSKQFGLKHFTCIQYISSVLINIIDLPILFPTATRLAATRQIGKIVSRVGWLKDEKYQRVVYTTAKNLQGRTQISSSYLSSDFDCAYLFALSHMAVDPQLQDILLKVIESYVPILTSNNNNSNSVQNEPYRNLNDIKIAVCKAVQKLDQSTERLFKIMKNLSEDTNVDPEVSSEASLALLCMSIKSNKRDTVKRITKGLSELILNSERSSDIKSAIKMLYNICSSDPSQKNELLPILMEFIKSDSTVHRDYALYILAKLEIELNHKEYVKEIADMVKNHFFKRMNDSTNQKNSLLKYVVKAASLICSNYIEYAAVLNESINTLLNSKWSNNGFGFVSASIFDVKIAFTENEIKAAESKLKSKKAKQKKNQEPKETENENEEDKNESKETNENDETDVLANEEKIDDVINDPFEGYEIPDQSISPNSIVVFNWRRELANSQRLVAFEMKVPEIGYSETSDYLPQRKGFNIYEDVVAHFVICSAYPEKANITLHSFFQRLADKERTKKRNLVLWEQIPSILDKFSVLNYVQLFFSLCLMQQQKQENDTSHYNQYEFDVVKELLGEMHTINGLIIKQKQEKLAKRVPITEPPPKTRVLKH